MSRSLTGGGDRPLSRRVANNEPDLLDLIGAVQKLACEITWAIDLVDGPAALLMALLLQSGQRLLYLPGIAVNRATSGYRGEGKSDSKDAAVIADLARMRSNLRLVQAKHDTIVELRMLTAHRADVAADRTRTIKPATSRLTGIFPALERNLDLSNHGPMVLISRFQTAHAIRSFGADGLHQWLRANHVRRSGKLVALATAAARQHTPITGEDIEASIIARLAGTSLDSTSNSSTSTP
jgi:hypothetical protein